MEKTDIPSVYISYSWNNSNIADEVQQILKTKDIDVKRDIKSVDYKESFTEFMEEIGKGEIVITIIGDEYLKSYNCMNEMVNINTNKRLHDRIFPIVMNDATKIYKESGKIDYTSYWEREGLSAKEKISAADSSSAEILYKIFSHCKKICDNLPTFLKFVSDRNNSSVEELRRTNYSIIIDSIEKRYCELVKKTGNAKLRFEMNTLDVPVSGGEYKIKIDANIPFDFEPKDGTQQRSSDRKSCNLFGTVKPITYSKEITPDKCLKINVSAASSLFMESACVYIYSGNGKCACLTINQEGDPTKPFEITTEGNSILNSIGSNMVKTLSLMHTIEGIYTQCWSHTQWLAFYNHKLDYSNNQISELFSGYDRIIRRLGTIGNQYDEPYINSAFSGIEALLYYQMGVLWGNVPYVTSDSLENGTNAIPKQSKEFLALFEKNLLSCINSFSSEKTSNTTAEGMIFPSKDVPRMILARMYMYNGEYAKALPLLQDIIKSNNYSLEANRLAAVKKESRELIYSFSLDNVVDNTFKNVIEANDVIPVITYAEVLLSTAECEYRLGNNSGTITYLNKVNQGRGLSSATTSNIITSLQATWKSELKGTGTYFAFLKRNGLAEQALNIESYKILLPIPQNQLNYNPNIIQNPGY